MKRIVAFALSVCMVLTLAACGKVNITTQQIREAGQAEALINNHQSVYIQEEMDGELWTEVYLTKDYFFNYIPSEEADWVEFITDEASYYYMDGDYLRYVAITPDGVSDFVSFRAERNEVASLGAGAEDYTIESAIKKDGRITVACVLNPDVLAAESEFGLTSAKDAYVLDAKTHEPLSITHDYSYDDGTALRVVTNVTYDGEVPEMVKTFLDYHSQTENLRNVTIVSNPGTDKEETKTIQVAKGLVIGLHYDDEMASAVEFYTDAACTQAYDPYANTDSDLTIYIKWIQ